MKVLFDRIGVAGREGVRRVLARSVADRWPDGPIRVKNTATLGFGVVRKKIGEPTKSARFEFSRPRSSANR